MVGLGPAGGELLTDPARAALTSGRPAYLRTRRHPAAEDLGDLTSFDHLYETAGTFEEVYAGIVEVLVAAAGSHPGGIVYGVPGSPLIAERTVELLRADPRVAVTVVPALSFLDLAWERVGVDPLAAGVRLVDGTRFAEDAAGERGPLLVAQCWSTPVLSQIKLSVDPEVAGDRPEVTVLHHLGLPDERVVTVPWDDLDRTLLPDHLTSLWVPRLEPPVAAELIALDELVRRLRADCPWDRAQTHRSLAPHLLEETYELLEAIDELDPPDGPAGGPAERAVDGPADAAVDAAVDHLCEELGDVLFQVYFHARLAAEEGHFTLADVAARVRRKLVSRHPHVFGDVVAEDPGTVVANWEVIKRREKGRRSVTDGIPAALPALALAAKLAAKAASIDPGDPDVEDRDLDAGRLLWLVADLVRRAGVDPEAALRREAARVRAALRAAEGVDG